MNNKELVLKQIDKEINHEIKILNHPVKGKDIPDKYTKLVDNTAIALLELCNQYMHKHYDLIKPLENVLNTNHKDELNDNIHQFISSVADDIVESLNDTFFDNDNLDINFIKIINFNILYYA